MVVPTHLDTVAQSLAGCAERGQWQQCVPMAACFVAGSSGGGSGSGSSDSIGSGGSGSGGSGDSGGTATTAAATTASGGASPRGGGEQRFPEMVGRMSARDRLVYALDVERYEALVLRGDVGGGDGGTAAAAAAAAAVAAAAAIADPTALTQNPLALNIARQEARGACDGTTLNGRWRWRLQREKKQRRWQ